MQLSENFTLEEMIYSSTASKKKIENFPNREALNNLRTLCEKILQPIRSKFAFPIKITSGYRSQGLNEALGGVPSSQHIKGEAADIKASNMKELWSLMLEMIRNKEIEVGQLIDEKNLSWIHVSLPDARHRNHILKLK